MSDATILQILIVEDSADDAKLLLADLERHGITLAHQRVESEAEYLGALQKQAWDAIISDYALPQFSGPMALKLLREQGGDTPFIMVSGIYGEAEAVAMMKAGANDYLMKGNLSRLAPALLREIEAAQDRRRHKRATGAMQYLAAIVESSEDAIYGKNLNSLIVSWNPAAERLFGFSTEEIVGQSVQKLYPRHLQDEMLDILGSVRRGDTIGIRETERLHKNGQIIPVAVTISPIRDTSGEIIGASTIARDISPQKKAELEKQKLMQRLEARAKRAAKAEDSDDPERVRPSSEETSDGQDPDAGTAPKLKNSAYAGFCSGGWKVFDTFEEAHSYAREWVAHQPAAEYKIYNVLREMVGKVVSGDALGNSADKRKEPQQKTWWKFWR